MRLIGFRSSVRRYVAAGALAAGALVTTGCSPGSRLPFRLPGVPHEPRTLAVLINGGGKPQVNYQSHLLHVKGMVELLQTSGMRREDIFIFSGDGSDPAADLATRETNPEPYFWLLPPRSVGRFLRPPTTLVDSTVDGFKLRAANRTVLREWFEKEGKRLRAGDTLLFYVTDHGNKNSDDLADNTITLWAESITVNEVRALFDDVDPDVEIVMLMSQCFSGSFANAIFHNHDDALPTGNVCGYFSSTADRPAYGCYPENRGKDGVGHSHHFIEALPSLGRLSEAHRRVLVTDDSPDVPHTTTDFFLDRFLHEAADESGTDFNTFVDELIAQAWENKGEWEPEIRLLDRIGQTFGVFSPRSLAELERQSELLPIVSDRLDTYAERWGAALGALAYENLQSFIEAYPEWKPRLEPKALKDLQNDQRSKTASELLDELLPFTRQDQERYERLLLLKKRADDASAARYRMEVRLGVVLRMRSVLTNIAGRVYLARQGTLAQLDAYDRLSACEDLSFLGPPVVASAAALEPPERFPSFEEDQRLVETVMPAWMGIRYRPMEEEERDGKPEGAVTVVTVFPESAAETAGLKVGDIILGPPDDPFEEPNEVREWTMRSEIGKPSPLKILRDNSPLRITLRPDPFPLEMPELPGPPKIGSAAPPLQVDLVQGTTELVEGKPRLLFFWATWCLPCKSALPEVLAFSQARGVEVVAITDEPAEKVEKFLHDFTQPFPSIVATDRYRQNFLNFGVSGTPTIVLVDADGMVRHYQTGYNAKLGLRIDGWEWEPEPKKVSARAIPDDLE